MINYNLNESEKLMPALINEEWLNRGYKTIILFNKKGVIK